MSFEQNAYTPPEIIRELTIPTPNSVDSSTKKLDGEQIEALRLSVSPLNRQEQKEHDDLELEVSNKFLDMYGTTLSEEQRLYMQTACLITVGENDNGVLSEWNLPHTVDNDDYQLNGVFYTGMRPKVQQVTSFAGGQSMASNKLTLYTMKDSHRGVSVSVDALDYNSRIKATQTVITLDTLSSSNTVFSQYVASDEFAKVAVHEKNHGIQDSGLPIPLLEAQAYWIQDKILEHYPGRIKEIIKSNKFASSYQVLYDKFGERLNLLLWGRIEDVQERKQLLDLVKAEMTPQFVDDMLPEGFEWVTSPVPTEEKKN